MPTFSPPLEPGPAPIGGRSHPLWRYYGNFDVGKTVWKDALGIWHARQMPYQGGGRDRFFHGDTMTETIDTDVNSLANATEVYMGGSVYDVTDAKATELRNAGFFVGGHWETEEDKWTNYIINTSPPNEGFKAGDATASILLVGGNSFWSHADTITGTVDGEGYSIDGVLVKNSLVHRDTVSGALVTQTYSGAPPSPAWAHPGAAGFTPMDMVYDGTGSFLASNIVVVGWSEPTTFGVDLLDGIVLILNAFTGAGTFIPYSTANGKFFALSVYNDTAFHYIIGREPDFSFQYFDPTSPVFNSGNIREHMKLARAPLGQLTTPANWQFWDGDAWLTDQAVAVNRTQSRLRDTQNEEVEGLCDLTKVGSNYIIAAMSNRSPAIRMYKSSNIEGPYTHYHTADNSDQAPDKGPSPPLNFKYWNGFPKFHEYLNPDAQTLVLSHSHQVFQPNFTLSTGPVHASIRRPNFIFLPTPEAVGQE